MIDFFETLQCSLPFKTLPRQTALVGSSLYTQTLAGGLEEQAPNINQIWEVSNRFPETPVPHFQNAYDCFYANATENV